MYLSGAVCIWRQFFKGKEGFMKHQNMRKTNGMKLICTGLLLLFLTAAMSLPVFAASNKAARMNMSFNARTEHGSEEEWDKNTYALGVVLKQESKLVNTQKYSARIIIPGDLLGPNRDSIGIGMSLTFLKNEKNGQQSIVGNIVDRHWFFVENWNGKVTVQVSDHDTGKNLKNAKYASVKKSGKNYVLTIKNAPLQTTFSGAQGENQKINTKTKYVLVPEIVVTGNFGEKASGHVDVDELSVKAKKTLTVTFDKKNYENADVYNFYERKPAAAPLVSVK